MKILVVDEQKTAQYLKKGLTENGYVVDVAGNGNDGFEQATQSQYDLIILDVMLPGRDGWTLLSDLRKGGKQTMTLMLTARDSVDDRVKGLDLGADAYLVKPFAFTELLAVIRTLVRRTPTRQSEIVKIEDLEIDLIHHRATRGGKRLELTPKEFALLSLLVRRSGEILSRTLISEQIWDMHFDCETNIVDVHIRRLRSKMDDEYSLKLIHTVRGMGYVLEAR